MKTLKQIFFSESEKDKENNENANDARYKSHTYLNIGQALHDLHYPTDFPKSESEKEAIENRAKSIALNLFYAAIDPATHHNDDDLGEMDEHPPEKWLKIGAEEVQTKKEDKPLKESIDDEIQDVPKNVEDHIPPFVKGKLSDDQLQTLEKSLATALDKLPYSREKIILMLLTVIDDLS